MSHKEYAPKPSSGFNIEIEDNEIKIAPGAFREVFLHPRKRYADVGWVDSTHQVVYHSSPSNDSRGRKEAEAWRPLLRVDAKWQVEDGGRRVVYDGTLAEARASEAKLLQACVYVLKPDVLADIRSMMASVGKRQTLHCTPPGDPLVTLYFGFGAHIQTGTPSFLTWVEVDRKAHDGRYYSAELLEQHFLFTERKGWREA